MSELDRFDAAIHDKRLAKVEPHLKQYAPVWIIEEELMPAESSILFSVMFQHNLYGWVNRRYLYDGFNDVLYHKGQIAMDEEAVLEIVEEREPFIEADVSDTQNAYGG
jgi:hypothetical protein